MDVAKIDQYLAEYRDGIIEAFVGVLTDKESAEFSSLLQARTNRLIPYNPVEAVIYQLANVKFIELRADYKLRSDK